MTDPFSDLRRDLAKLTQRVEDVATAFAHLREEVDVNTTSVRDLLLWVVHRPIPRSAAREPELRPKTKFEE